MRQVETIGLTVEQVQEMARRELSTPTRIGYLLLLMFTLMGAGLIGTLWLTEPGPLPLRTQVAFGLLVAINLSWSALFGWVLTQRKVLFAIHSVIAGWMAVAFCSVFLLFGLAIGIYEDESNDVHPRRCSGNGSAVCRNHDAETFATSSTRIAGPSP